MTVQFDEDKQKLRLQDLRKEEEEGLANAMATKFGVPYIDLTMTPINIDSLRIISEAEAKDSYTAVFNEVDKIVSIGVLSPQNTKTIETVNRLKEKGYQVEVYMVSHASLKKVWNLYKELSYSFETKSGALDISNEQISEFLSQVNTIADVQKIISEVLMMKKSYRISRIMEIILAGAISLKASDVHIEPEADFIRIRYRLDGMLTDILEFDKDTYTLLLSRIKLISNLKLNVAGSQDGRFSIIIKDVEIEIRTSLLPGGNGESVVLRVLNPDAINVNFDELGISPKLQKILEVELAKPNGMILNTGPTGSGKTTTLYAFLKKVFDPQIKIITIEDPIEYHLPGVVQTQVDEKKNYTFAEGLRSAVRQDPDIIMVGEIRDRETADIAINSALTGHLVFSTLHTNDAAGSFPRLIDLGINPKVISSAINITMAQRLVRRLCPYCIQKVPITPEDKKIVDGVIASIVDKSIVQDLDLNNYFHPVGCDKCSGIGYKGRVGIFEAILMDENIERVIQENPSEREVSREAKYQNILNMTQDGVVKVLSGITSMDELKRVIDTQRF